MFFDSGDADDDVDNEFADAGGHEVYVASFSVAIDFVA